MALSVNVIARNPTVFIYFRLVKIVTWSINVHPRHPQWCLLVRVNINDRELFSLSIVRRPEKHRFGPKG